MSWLPGFKSCLQILNLYTAYAAEDVRELCGAEGLTLERMEELLVNNQLTDFDPVQAAFDAVDHNGSVRMGEGGKRSLANPNWTQKQTRSR
jgi:hypothetical protein